jgi:Flp pilus assembly protein TadG
MNHHEQPKKSQLAKRQKGVAVVEFALTAILFFTVVFAIVDFSYLFWSNLTMQHAVREGARYAITGQSDLDSSPTGTAQDRCDAAVEEIRRQSMGLFAKISPTVRFSTVTNFDPPTITEVPSNSCAAATQIVVITVNGTLPLLTPFVRPFFTDGNYVFSVSTAMRNEAFR